MATFLGFYTSEIPTIEPSLGVAEQTMYLVQVQTIVKSSEEAAGTRWLKLFRQEGGIDDNEYTHCVFSPATGWAIEEQLSDISPTALKTQVTTSEPLGSWTALDNTEFSALYLEAIGS